ncbi:hypothetical protein [Frankia sp. CcWB2]
MPRLVARSIDMKVSMLQSPGSLKATVSPAFVNVTEGSVTVVGSQTTLYGASLKKALNNILPGF